MDSQSLGLQGSRESRPLLVGTVWAGSGPAASAVLAAVAAADGVLMGAAAREDMASGVAHLVAHSVMASGVAHLDMACSRDAFMT